MCAPVRRATTERCKVGCTFYRRCAAISLSYTLSTSQATVGATALHQHNIKSGAGVAGGCEMRSASFTRICACVPSPRDRVDRPCSLFACGFHLFCFFRAGVRGFPTRSASADRPAAHSAWRTKNWGRSGCPTDPPQPALTAGPMPRHVCRPMPRHGFELLEAQAPQPLSSSLLKDSLSHLVRCVACQLVYFTGSLY